MNTLSPTAPPDWIALSREQKSIAEAGLRYSEDPYDLKRHQRRHYLDLAWKHAENPALPTAFH